MNRKRLIIILLCIAAAVAGALVTWYYTRPDQERDQDDSDEHPTNWIKIFKDKVPPADTLIVGKWQNTDHPGWYKAYYDDLDEEEQQYWGKEWNEEEDVLEEDLNYHGNGWFRWIKKGSIMHEFATMDTRDVPIHREYKIVLSSADSLVYFETAYKTNFFRFARVKD